MAWRRMEERSSADSAARKEALHGRVLKKVPVGLLGYAEGEPVAWCSVAPRETFLRLSQDQDDEEDGVWSVVCFFVRSDLRQSGRSGRLLDEAIKLEKKPGAQVLEVSPVDPASTTYRFMVYVALVEGPRCAPVGRAGG